MKRVQSFEDARRRRGRVFRFLRLMVLLFFVYEFFSAYIMKTRIIESSSMAPTLVPKERVIVLSSAYGLLNPINGRHGMFRAPQRGDIVLQRLPSSPEHPWFFRFMDSVIRYVTFQRVSLPGMKTPFEAPVIKRVVAVPGDTVKMNGYIVQVKSEGSSHFLTEYEVTDATYDIGTVDVPDDWDDGMPLSGTQGELLLGPDEYFVVGDNRTSSADSRFFGAVSSHDLIGRIFVRYWPLDRFSSL
jgi:signal peptidase I